jgi:hypothetical protein
MLIYQRVIHMDNHDIITVPTQLAILIMTTCLAMG